MRSGRIRLLEDGPGAGDRNMAVDEALLGTARNGLVTLRFYGWMPPCLSLGRNERARGAYDAAEAARRGVDVVRRPTGGRAVYHDDELTYAVTAPADAWGGLRESYGRINRALARGLRALGIPAETAGDGAGRRSDLAGAGPCFRDPATGEVMARGRKLVGSAQWRNDGALLQHGSILLSDRQAVVEELRRPRGAGSGSGAVGLVELLGRRPAPGELAAALRAGFEEEMERPVEPGAVSSAEREQVRRLEGRYRDAAWTWRR